jgi:hypothetical protein
MPAIELRRRRLLDVVFGLFIATGVTVGAVCLLTIGNWVYPQGEGAFGIFYLGVFSLLLSLVAWLAGGVYLILAFRDRDVGLGVALSSAHLMWWLSVVGIELWRDDPTWSWVMRLAAILEPSLYGVG